MSTRFFVHRLEPMVLPNNFGCVRGVVAQTAIILAAFWCLFAAFKFPWIVGPDFDPDYETAAQRTSLAGLWMAAMSVATLFFAVGLFGLGRRSWRAAVGLGLGTVAGVPCLLPSRDAIRASTGCVAALMTGLLLLLTVALLNRAVGDSRSGSGMTGCRRRDGRCQSAFAVLRAAPRGKDRSATE